MTEVETELENTRKWARKSCVLQEQQAAEIEFLNALWACEHETVLHLVAERDALAKRWKDLKDWAFYSNALTNDDSARMLMYMRETEKQ